MLYECRAAALACYKRLIINVPLSLFSRFSSICALLEKELVGNTSGHWHVLLLPPGRVSLACSIITHLHPHGEFINLLFLEGFHGLPHSPKAHTDIQLTLMVKRQFISSISLILGMSFLKQIPFHILNTW